jgi:acetylornithine/succinyldiaminopimelate/putrescine aminotransferase
MLYSMVSSLIKIIHANFFNYSRVWDPEGREYIDMLSAYSYVFSFQKDSTFINFLAVPLIKAIATLASSPPLWHRPNASPSPPVLSTTQYSVNLLSKLRPPLDMTWYSQ